MDDTNQRTPSRLTFDVDADTQEVMVGRRWTTATEAEAQRLAGSVDGQMGRQTASVDHESAVDVSGCTVELTITAHPHDPAEMRAAVLGSIARCVDEMYRVAAEYDLNEATDVAWFNYKNMVRRSEAEASD